MSSNNLRFFNVLAFPVLLCHCGNSQKLNVPLLPEATPWAKVTDSSMLSAPEQLIGIALYWYQLSPKINLVIVLGLGLTIVKNVNAYNKAQALDGQRVKSPTKIVSLCCFDMTPITNYCYP